MKPMVYVETTIASFYHDVRTEPEMVARREWTRRWWEQARSQAHLVTSAAVLSELEEGNYPSRQACMALLADLPVLPITREVIAVVQTYIARYVMPADPTGDALHLALASQHRCDFLVTWNCQHLANPSKFGLIDSVNNALGLFVPIIVTPLQLLGESPDEQ